MLRLSKMDNVKSTCSVRRSCQTYPYQQPRIPSGIPAGIPGGCSPDPTVVCTVRGQPGMVQPGHTQPGQPQPGQPGRQGPPLPGRVEFPLPGRAMGLPPTSNAAQTTTGDAASPAQAATGGSSGCVPDCANGGTCRNGACVCPPGISGEACHNGR